MRWLDDTLNASLWLRTSEIVVQSVANILVTPKNACMTVWPAPHMMACDVSIPKLDVLYTKATEAELSTPRVSGRTNPMNRIINE